MNLTTQRLTLRPPAPRDAEAIIAYTMSERARYTGGNVPVFQAWSHTAATFGHWQLRGFGLWAVTFKDSDEIIGLVGPFYPMGWPETEVGWILFDSHEGQGLAFEAATAAMQDARQRLGWTTIVHYIAPENARSIALAERLGARLDPAATPPFPDKPSLVYRQPESTA